jgi:CubicO group peptidase (beta-lactamase class C family)
VVERILHDAAVTGVAPGGVLLVVDGGAVVHRFAFGRTQIEPPGSGEPVTETTLFDVASLTKPVVTVACTMKLVGAGALDLAAPVSRWIAELPSGSPQTVTVRQLLAHSAGFPAHQHFYRRVLAGDLAGAASSRLAILRMAAAAPLAYPPGIRSLYSDLGFILLGFVLERASGQRLDALAQRLVFEPVGMSSSRFVDLAQPGRPAAAAATERCPYRGVVRGEVHDQNTHAAGGILGQAGLFTTADDLSRFALAIMDGAAGFSRDVTAEFLKPSGVPGSTWCLGWDTPHPSAGESQAGDLWPRTGVGHLGFTGCSLWLDPPRRRLVVLLTNSIHPAVQKTRTKALRRAVMDAVVAALPP